MDVESKLTEEQRKDYARWLIKDQAQEIEGITYHESFELWPEWDSLLPEDDPDPFLELSREDFDAVSDLVRDARVTVTWEG